MKTILHTLVSLFALTVAAIAQTPTPAPHSQQWLDQMQTVKSLNYRTATQNDLADKVATIDSLLANSETKLRDSVWLNVTKVRILNAIPARRDEAVTVARELVERQDWIYPSFAAEILQIQGKHVEAKAEALRIYNKYCAVNADHALVAAKVAINSMRVLDATPQEVSDFARTALLGSGCVTQAAAATDVYKAVNPSLMTTSDYAPL